MRYDPPGFLALDALGSMVKERAKFVGSICCDKADWRLFKGKVIVACPDHEPMIEQDGKLVELKPRPIA